MLRILSSTADVANKDFAESKRLTGEDNLAWLTRQLGAAGQGLRKPFGWAREGKQGESPPSYVVLLGGRGHYAFRLRIAQAHLRHDFTASHWSHVLLIGALPERPEATKTYEISLQPPKGFGVPTATNGLQVGRLGTYRDAERFPNVAVLRIAADPREWEWKRGKHLSVLGRYEKQLSTLDATELIVKWLSFLWGVGRAGNPLLDGYGIPSAAMIEVILAAVRFDLTPGVESRASCPEAIWQTAKWWHSYYTEKEQTPLLGAWAVDHKIES